MSAKITVCNPLEDCEVILDVFPNSEADCFELELIRRNRIRLGSFPYLLRGCKIAGAAVIALTRQYSHPLTLAQCQQEIETHGEILIRPYQLGQGWDQVCESCVMALFANACHCLGLNPVALYGRAYPWVEPADRLEWQDLETDIAFAEWQGVGYPEVWNQQNLNALKETLEEINLHSLVVVMNAALNGGGKYD
jgi:hypothetical protein